MSETAANTVNGRVCTAMEGVVSLVEFPVCEMFSEKTFHRMLYLERKRAERSKRQFVLMLLESGSLRRFAHDQLGKMMSALSRATRETDIKGWYTNGRTIGVILTEIGQADGKAVAGALLGRVTDALSSCFSGEEIKEIQISFHVFPDDASKPGQSGPIDPILYPELVGLKRNFCIVKRSMDIAGSLCALILSCPLLVVISLLIKLTSKGPILFRQTRVGQHGKAFTFLKFRSMYFANDPRIHQDYVKLLIAGEIENDIPSGAQKKVYKLTNDPRITPIGKFLRKTSLDELPQFLNVLKGEMSIVGPRPPVPYEFQSYEIWHRQRVVSVKPGITGLWQVSGRSNTKFADMVRLDLEYARSWSPGQDLMIMLRTPRVIFSGDGAY
jgi:lipopolysaccharide/colanic/teichoic acid biosynthesis glycosyltransferase